MTAEVAIDRPAAPKPGSAGRTLCQGLLHRGNHLLCLSLKLLLQQASSIGHAWMARCACVHFQNATSVCTEAGQTAAIQSHLAATTQLCLSQWSAQQQSGIHSWWDAAGRRCQGAEPPGSCMHRLCGHSERGCQTRETCGGTLWLAICAPGRQGTHVVLTSAPICWSAGWCSRGSSPV